ncbi:hypothetical protein [Nonomuraea sp. NPDC049695]|uniref:hypothetical protein n=1 Tax=Nonomuraea sp. NPDC049695 TaxID=3154734 RepID=UPI00342DD1F9
MPSTHHVPRTRVALAAFACLAGLLAGCGNAAEPSGAAKNPPASADTADQKYTEWEIKFRSCLSDKGFELPKEPGKIDFGDRQDAYKVAEDACVKQIGKPPTASDDQPAKSGAEAEERKLKQLQCLRDHGYRVKDPGEGQAPQIEVPEGVSEDGLTKCLSQ